MSMDNNSTTNPNANSEETINYKDAPGVEVVQGDFATIAARCTGSISTISSFLIIYLIFKSKTKLTTIYHRLMLGMCIADIMGSIAMGLTTIPMPRDGVPDFGWAGTRLGNRSTCTAQGFFFITGFVCMFGYNMTLCVYNALAIAFRMREHNITKYAEPFFHIVPIGLALVMSVPLLVIDLKDGDEEFNGYIPSGWDVWCTPISRPMLEQAVIGLILVVTLCCFISMILRVYQVDKQLRGPIRKIVRQSRRIHRAEKSFENTKVVVKQCFVYFLSYLFTLSLALGRTFSDEEPLWFANLALSMMPLQGFYNFCIFLIHKVYNYKLACQRRNDDITPNLCHIIFILFRGEPEEIILFSRISIIRYDKQNERLMNLELANEMDYEVLIEDSISFEMKRTGTGYLVDQSDSVGESSVGEVLVDNNSQSDKMYDLSGFSVSSLRSTPLQPRNSQKGKNISSVFHSIKSKTRTTKSKQENGFLSSSCSPSNTTETKRETQPSPARSHTSLFAESQDHDSLKDAENQCQVSMDASASVSIFSRWLGE